MDLIVLGIAEGSGRDDVKVVAQQLGKTYPLALDQDGHTAIGFGVTGVPETFFIGKDGLVLYHQIGMFDKDALKIFDEILSKEQQTESVKLKE